MCATNVARDLRARWTMALGNFSLVAAILIWNFSRQSAGAANGWIDGISGLFFGVSIGSNLMALRLSRRCGPGAAPQRG
jgi:hypothetical protein